jgi:hypothetical protein
MLFLLSIEVLPCCTSGWSALQFYWCPDIIQVLQLCTQPALIPNEEKENFIIWKKGNQVSWGLWLEFDLKIWCLTRLIMRMHYCSSAAYSQWRFSFKIQYVVDLFLVLIRSTYYVRYEFLIVITMKIAVYWDVVKCNLVDFFRHFQGICYPDDESSKLHNIISQETVIFRPTY